MYKQHIPAIVFFAALIVTAFAQQSPFGGNEVVTPEIHEDHRVTFRIYAPGAD